MKFFSDCSGDCKDCLIHYYHSCLAGHGDDDFVKITKKDVIELLNKNMIKSYDIKYLKEKFNLK